MAGAELEAEQQHVRDLWARLVRWSAPADGGRPTVQSVRAGFERLGEQLPVPEEASVREDALGGVPALRVTTGADLSRTVLLVHSGAFVMGSARAYRSLAAGLADTARAEVVALDYRRAPEHPFPAALEDVVAAYLAVLAGGTPACDVCLVGDSAGGGLVVSALVALRDAGEPLPAAAVLVSPLTDCTLTSDSLTTHAERDPATSRGVLSWLTRQYLDGLDPADPRVSPVRADLSGLPPLLVLVGTEEVLLDDATGLVARAQEHGVDATLHVGPGQAHIWPFFAPVLSAGRDAVELIGEFVRHHTTDGGAPA